MVGTATLKERLPYAVLDYWCVEPEAEDATKIVYRDTEEPEDWLEMS